MHRACESAWLNGVQHLLAAGAVLIVIGTLRPFSGDGLELEKSVVEDLLSYEKKGPNARMAAPTPEHFLPLFFALGAAEGETPLSYFHSIRHGNGLLCAMKYGR